MATGFANPLNVPYPGTNRNAVLPVRQQQRRRRAERAHGQGSVVDLVMIRSTVPTSWFWNIRVGDKLQINGSGLWYTVVGPMVVTSGSRAIPSCS